MTDPITHHAAAILRAAGSSGLAYYMTGAQHRIRAAVTAAIEHGIRMGLDAASDDALTWFPEVTTGQYRAGGVPASIRALDPAAILAQSAGGGDE